MKKTESRKKTRKPTLVRRQEIIDAGMKILAAEGGRQFTAERLGAEVGIAGGTIFRHFGSMEEILDAIVDRIEEIIFADFPPKAVNPLERLRLFFDCRIEAISRHPEISKLLLTPTLIPNGPADHREKRLVDFKMKSRLFVINCLKKAEAEELLSGDIDFIEGSVLVLGSIYAIGHMGIGLGKNRKKEILSGRIWEILEKLLSKGN